MEVVTLSQYAAMDRPEISWLVRGLLPMPGFALLLGQPKSGKSFLALQLALAVAKGQDFMGHSATRGRVLYLQFDTSEMVWRDRLQGLKEEGHDIEGQVFMIDPKYQPTWANILETGTQRAIEGAIVKCNPSLIVIDVLREIHSSDENDSTAMKIVCDTLRRLTFGRAVLLLHHTHKLGAVEEPDPISCLRGSSYIAGMAETIWLVHKNLLYVSPRFTETEVLDLRQGAGGFFSFPHAQAYSDKTKKVLALCAMNPTLGHNRIATLAEVQLGMSRRTFFRHLDEGVCVHRMPKGGGGALPALPLAGVLPGLGAAAGPPVRPPEVSAPLQPPPTQ